MSIKHSFKQLDETRRRTVNESSREFACCYAARCSDTKVTLLLSGSTSMDLLNYIKRVCAAEPRLIGGLVLFIVQTLVSCCSADGSWWKQEERGTPAARREHLGHQ